MVFDLVATILILAIAFYQVLQGLYSALIMTFLSIVSLTLAFNFYEPLAALLQKYITVYAEPAALIALLVVPLAVLRVLFDRYLGRNVVAGVWTNRIGGGILGIVTGMVLVGVLAVAIQMLPYGASVLTYQPYGDDLRKAQGLAPFYPDDFVLGLARVLSAGPLRTSPAKPFEQAHNSLKLELFCARNDAGKGGRTDATPGAMSISGVYAPEAYGDSWAEKVPNNPALGEVITRVVVVRLAVSQSARDSDGWWRLPGTHFRLTAAGGREYYPVGYLVRSRAGDLECVGPPKENDVLMFARLTVEREGDKDAKNLSVDWVYRLPEGEHPAEVVFRRTAKAPIRSLERRSPDPYGALERMPKERRY
jgi:hypothetical protein